MPGPGRALRALVRSATNSVAADLGPSGRSASLRRAQDRAEFRCGRVEFLDVCGTEDFNGFARITAGDGDGTHTGFPRYKCGWRKVMADATTLNRILLDLYGVHRSDPDWLEKSLAVLTDDCEVVNIPLGATFHGPSGYARFIQAHQKADLSPIWRRCSTRPRQHFRRMEPP
ncbi:hypothetical protein GCM10023096_64420 [Nonomuraea ferruginea]